MSLVSCRALTAVNGRTNKAEVREASSQIRACRVIIIENIYLIFARQLDTVKLS